MLSDAISLEVSTISLINLHCLLMLYMKEFLKGETGEVLNPASKVYQVGTGEGYEGPSPIPRKKSA